MPKIVFQDTEFEVSTGENLRVALLKHRLSPYHPKARWVNCRGLGTCGTCAVRVTGPVEPKDPGGVEAWRLGFPPHRRESNLRLACQLRVCGDLALEKLPGFWGQG